MQYSHLQDSHKVPHSPRMSRTLVGAAVGTALAYGLTFHHLPGVGLCLAAVMAFAHRTASSARTASTAGHATPVTAVDGGSFPGADIVRRRGPAHRPAVIDGGSLRGRDGVTGTADGATGDRA